MIEFDDALRIILRNCRPLGTVRRPLSAASGEVLAEHIRTRDPIPPFASSSMDGYALRSADTVNADAKTGVMLSVAGIVHAGKTPGAAVRRGTTIRIMTGAQIPRGADAVVMQERVSGEGEAIRLHEPVRRGSNIRSSGEEFRKNAIVARKGTLITPPVAGLIATAGNPRILVYRKPRVAILVTGSELRPVGAKLGPGQIHDANSISLTAALQTLGVHSVVTSSVTDRPDRVSSAVDAALRSSDIVITVGGISVGDRDYIRETMAAHDVREQFWRVAMKPGKPNYFGTKGETRIFGLPGNPVSALLSFHLLVRPAIMRMTGREEAEPLTVTAKLAEDLRKQPGRLEFVRMKLTGDAEHGFVAMPVRGQASHMLSGLSSANGLFRFPRQASAMCRGSRIPVEIIQWWPS